MQNASISYMHRLFIGTSPQLYIPDTISCSRHRRFVFLRGIQGVKPQFNDFLSLKILTGHLFDSYNESTRLQPGLLIECCNYEFNDDCF